MRAFYRLAVIFLATILLVSTHTRAQSLYEVSSDEKISYSSLIVEGKVVAQKSYWNSQHTMILTSSEVEIYKIFKGTESKKTIEIVTNGGTVDNYSIQASDLLQLDKNDIGLFYCRANRAKSILSRETTYEVYSSAQGFLKYDLLHKTASAPFITYHDIEDVLYQELYKKTGNAVKIKNHLFSIQEASRSITPANGLNATLAPVITSFSPATVTAGTLLDPSKNVLTINGSGFDSTPDSTLNIISFAHTDKAVGNFFEVSSKSDLVVSWSDTQIKIRVPSTAGSGIFQVRNSSGTTGGSGVALNVLYSVLSGFIPALSKTVQFNLANLNGTGGYSFKYSTNTTNSGVNINISPAKGTVQRAIATWTELTGANLVEAGTTSIQKIDPYDAENIVTFDNGGSGLGGPLPSGVLATCYSGFSACDLSKPFFKSGFDIIIRNAGYSTGTVATTFGPCSPYTGTVPQVDLETVLLHELGHALNLGHIIDGNQGSGGGHINPAKLMNFSVSYNLRRITPDYSAMAGVTYLVTPQGYAFGSCLPASADMNPLPITLDTKDECPASFPSSVTPLFSTVSFDLAHSTSNKTVDPGYNQYFADGSTTSITNTAYYPIKTNANGGDLSLEVNNYSTLPVEIAACVPGGSTAVTGVELTVYKVAACPTGQAYPTPVSTVIFTGNGIVPTITGLSPNANYLLVLDGVENTKASFNIVFSGSTLSTRFTNFSGISENNFNRLEWTMELSDGINTMFLERSSDGINFIRIAEISASAQQLSGSYNDGRFFPGDNYYRLAVLNTDGSTQYSKIVTLNRKETLLVHVYPNPATNQSISVELYSQTPGNYYISLTNALGQMVLNKRVTVAGTNHLEKLSLASLNQGIYHLSIFNGDQKKVKSVTITVAK